MGKIVFKNLNVLHKIKESKKFKKFLENIFNIEGVEFQNIIYIFCTDAYLTKINEEFLRHKTLTDIITFNLASTKPKIQGEIYISIERIKENSLKYHTTYSKELNRVMIHGILHLCGYDDKTKSQKEKMTEKENKYLLQLKS